MFFFLKRIIKKQKDYLATSIYIDIAEISNRCDDSLTQKDFKKIKGYYGLSVPVIGDVYCLLRGETLNGLERNSLTYLGGLTGLFDDFFDEKNTPNDHILELINNPREVVPTNDHEKLFIQFYLKALKEQDFESLHKIINDVFDAQILSKKQLESSLSFDEINHITQQKGSLSLLFYRSVLTNKIEEDERSFIRHLGLIGQLENDIFDVYKDSQQGIHTLVTTAKSISSLRAYYAQLIDESYKLIANLNGTRNNKQQFSKLLAIISTRGLVSLDQLAKLEKHDPFEVSKYTRSQLICDMGKLKNIIRWFWYYLKSKTI